MLQATRKAAELIKLVTYCNNANAYCANLSCTHPRAHTHTKFLKEIFKKAKHSRVVQKIQYYEASKICKINQS